MAMTGPDTSSMALRLHPSGHSMFDVVLNGLDDDDGIVDDKPMASTNPKSESVLIENPSRGKNTKVPISETGTARRG